MCIKKASSKIDLTKSTDLDQTSTVYLLRNLISTAKHVLSRLDGNVHQSSYYKIKIKNNNNYDN